MKKYVIKLNGKVYEVEMGEAGAAAAYTPAPTASPAPTAAPAAPAAAPSAAPTGGEVVTAPMPGNIISVNVKAGDVIKKGHLLVVLEAMKMENEIVSPCDGTVIAVNAAKGTAVNVSEELVRIG